CGAEPSPQLMTRVLGPRAPVMVPLTDVASFSLMVGGVTITLVSVGSVTANTSASLLGSLAPAAMLGARLGKTPVRPAERKNGSKETPLPPVLPGPERLNRTVVPATRSRR